MPSLSFKARLNVKPFIWKWLFLLRRRKLIFTREVLRVALVRKRGFWNSGNSLFLVRKHGWTCYLHSWRSLVFWEKNKKKMSCGQIDNSRFFYSFVVHFCWSFLENRALGKGKNKWRHHDVISWVCTLSEHSSPPISAREIAQLSWKRNLKFCFLINYFDENYWQRWNLWTWEIFFGSHLLVVFYTYLRRWSTLKFTRAYISPFFVRHFS